MTAQKRKKSAPPPINSGFDEAVARFIQTIPAELAEVMTRDLTDRMKRTNQRIREAREEIDRGARSGKKPFRL
jgi:hypothetical protein